VEYYYVTGPNRGIGRALVDRVLATKPEAVVVGLGRSATVGHPRYRHQSLDLTDTAAVQVFSFPGHTDATRVVLVNNAGSLTVKPIGLADPRALVNEYLVNLVAPALLMNSFLAAYRSLNVDRQIVNISSGAGQRPFDGWATYCASKAGLDMLSRSVALEQELAGGGVRVLSIAPGVADTDMQGVIRSTAPEDFSRVQEFVDYKATGGLASPETIALKLCRVMDDPALTPDVLVSLRNIPEA
jgi:benzil reductase ((S)-benzoin forming)